MVVYLIRHTSVDVPQGVCYGQTDVPLNPTFEEPHRLPPGSKAFSLIKYI